MFYTQKCAKSGVVAEFSALLFIIALLLILLILFIFSTLFAIPYT